MVVIVVFAVAAAAAALVFTLLIAAAALGFAFGAFGTALSGRVSKKDIRYLIIGAFALFAALMVFLSNVDPRSKPGFVDWALLSYIVFIVSALSMSLASVFLRILKGLSLNLSSLFVVSVSYILIFLGIYTTDDFLLFNVSVPEPIEMSIGGDVTHCVYAGVAIYERSHKRDKILDLEKGEKVRLSLGGVNLSDAKIGHLGDTRYILPEQGQKVVFGRGVFVRAMANGECRN